MFVQRKCQRRRSENKEKNYELNSIRKLSKVYKISLQARYIDFFIVKIIKNITIEVSSIESNPITVTWKNTVLKYPKNNCLTIKITFLNLRSLTILPVF